MLIALSSDTPGSTASGFTEARSEQTSTMFTRGTIIATALWAAIIASSAFALPTLQLYTPGGDYDAGTETWVTVGNPFALQVIGARSPAWVDAITDVRLIVTVPEGYNDAGDSVTIESTAWLSPQVLGNGGAAPQAIPGSEFPIPSHGIAPEYFWVVGLPDLMVGSAGLTIWNMEPGENDSGIGDVQDYTLTSSFSALHFDVMGTAVGANGSAKDKDVVAPFSHDAEFHGEGWGPGDSGDEPPGAIPEPATIGLFGACLAGMALKIRRKLRNPSTA